MPHASESPLQGKIYNVRFTSSGAILSNENGVLCDEIEGRAVALALAGSYAPGAYVYVGAKDKIDENGEANTSYKVGMSYDLKRRQQELGISIIHTIPCANSRYARAAEAMLHQVFDFYCIGGEWFDLDEDEVNDLRGLIVYDDVVTYYWKQNPLSIECTRYQPGTVRHFAQTMRLISEAKGGNEKAKGSAILHMDEIRGWIEEVEQRILASENQ